MTYVYEHPYRREGWEREIYPMPAFPMLSVADVERASRWYRETFGFADVFTMRGPDGTTYIAHLRWSFFADVLLVPAREPIPEPRGRGVTLNFATESADTIAERARASGVEPVDGPTDRPWNARDVTFVDPDGYRLTFTAPSAATIERIAEGKIEPMEQVVARIRERLGGR